MPQVLPELQDEEEDDPPQKEVALPPGTLAAMVEIFLVTCSL